MSQSWIVVRRATNEVIGEFFDRRTVERFNPETCEIKTASDYFATLFDRPLASAPYTSYRYMGRCGWVMIGAMNTGEALREAARSIDGTPVLCNLQVWDGGKYAPVSA